MRTRTRLAITLVASAALLTGLAAPASALSPTEQVADLNAGTANSYPYDLTVVGDLLYFTADDGTGTELYVTDGSIGSATKIDINPSGGSDPSDLTVVGDGLYLSADTGAYGRELVGVSGTNVSILSDLNPGTADSNPTDITEFNGDIYFTATSPAEGQAVRKFDGGSVTTYPTTELTTAPSGYFEYQGLLYFSASTGGASSQLFSLDGTNPVTLVKILNPTSFANPHNFAVAGGVLYFLSNVAPAGSYSYELWSWDGSAAAQLTSGLASTNDTGLNRNGFQYFTVYNDTLYFAAGTTAMGPEIGSTTGGALPTFYDINPGAAGSNVEEITGYKGSVYFGADDGVNGSELFSLQAGSVATLRADVNPGAADGLPYNFTVVGDALAFAASGTTDAWELWSFNGTTATQESSINPGASADPFGLAAFNGYIYFDATSAASGAELWRTLVTASAATGTAALAATGSDPVLPIGIASLLLLAGAVVMLTRRSATAV